MSLALLAGVLFAACGGGDDGGGDKAYVEPKGPATETIDIEAQNFYVHARQDHGRAGHRQDQPDRQERHPRLRVRRRLHGFRLEADGGGGTESSKIDLKPGKYTFYCSITGHRAQGMEGTLTVK